MLGNSNQACQIGANPLSCGAGKAFTIEIFSNADPANIKSLGFFKLTHQMLECMTDNKIQVHF